MSRRKQNGDGIGDRKLMDRIALDEGQLGPMRGLLATTYELDPEFFEIRSCSPRAPTPSARPP